MDELSRGRALRLAAMLLLFSVTRASKFVYPGWALNRTEPLSNDGPLAFEFNKEENTAGRQGILQLINHFEDIGTRVAIAARTSNYALTARRQVCNVSNQESVTAINVKMRTLGFGAFESTCITELCSENHDMLWSAVSNMVDTMKASSAALIRATIRRKGTSLAEPVNERQKWERGYAANRHEYESFLSKCELLQVLAFRVKGVWAIAAGVTSANPVILKGDYQRQYTEELLSIKGDGSLGNIEMRVNGSVNGVISRIPCTTTLSSWGGKPASSAYFEVADIGKNPAISTALLSGKRWQQQAEDSITLSNIAIMLLPMSLSLVPLALFADASAIAVIAYAVFTDILSCLPLGIKGIELMQLSGIVHKGTKSWAYGLETPQALGVSELWLARCRSQNRLSIIGAIFASVALVTMVLGMSLELYARHRLKQTKNYNMVLAAKYRNVAVRRMFARESRCNGCQCYAERISCSPSRSSTEEEFGSGGIFLAGRRRKALESSLDPIEEGV